jgi:hypothetical protein
VSAVRVAEDNKLEFPTGVSLPYLPDEAGSRKATALCSDRSEMNLSPFP